MQRVLPIADDWPLFDVATTREFEQQAAASVPTPALMQRAGEAVARLALAIAPHARRIRIVAGPGNNGGDALEAAMHLRQSGKRVLVELHASASRPVDARAALVRAQAAGVEIGTPAGASAEPVDLAIDGLLGIGANRAPQGLVAASIRTLNALHCPVLAIDVPSGLDADTGCPVSDTDVVVATHTLSLLTLKPGLFTAAGRDHAGSVWFDALGTRACASTPQAWLSGALGLSQLPVRRHAQHKGSFGDVVVIGGARGMRGAALLAARAAHAAGAGRVHVHLLDATGEASGIDPLWPELMFGLAGLPGTPDLLARAAVVCGCGGGAAVRTSLPRVLSLAARLVLDADALNAVACDASLEALLRARTQRGVATVLTPHPLEAARLLACSAREVQADRLRAARELSVRFDCVVVLKGSGSVIAAPHEVARINATGNPALASAGTGDVLAGWLGGRWGQRAGIDAAQTAFAAAIQAVAEHGAAAEPQPSGALRAGALIDRLARSLAPE